MRREAGGPCLSAVFVDYDNIYLSLKRKSEEAAKRFAKDASVWLRAIETGRLITATNAPFGDGGRRIVMNRCYGNPVPRRNAHDNSTDMNSFPFVRHHFLRAGFEVVDCPPLTAQLKNSSDIRMVMDVRDYLTHDTYFDEFIILSGDADFTPVLHRLRAHARRTVIFANDFTPRPTPPSAREVPISSLDPQRRAACRGGRRRSRAPSCQPRRAGDPGRGRCRRHARLRYCSRRWRPALRALGTRRPRHRCWSRSPSHTQLPAEMLTEDSPLRPQASRWQGEATALEDPGSRTRRPR
jgi:hypothetical protein